LLSNPSQLVAGIARPGVRIPAWPLNYFPNLLLGYPASQALELSGAWFFLCGLNKHSGGFLLWPSQPYSSWKKVLQSIFQQRYFHIGAANHRCLACLVDRGVRNMRSIPFYSRSILLARVWRPGIPSLRSNLGFTRGPEELGGDQCATSSWRRLNAARR